MMKKRKVSARLFSILLVLALCIGLLPTAALAKVPDTYVEHTPQTYTLCSSHGSPSGGNAPGSGEYLLRQWATSGMKLFKGDIIEFIPDTYDPATVPDRVGVAVTLDVGFVFTDDAREDITPSFAEILAAKESPNGTIYQKIRITSDAEIILYNKGGAGPTGSSVTVQHPTRAGVDLKISDRYSHQCVRIAKASVSASYSAEGGIDYTNPKTANGSAWAADFPDEIRFNGTDYTFTLPNVSGFIKDGYVGSAWRVRDLDNNAVNNYIAMTADASTGETKVTVRGFNANTDRKNLCFYINYYRANTLTLDANGGSIRGWDKMLVKGKAYASEQLPEQFADFIPTHPQNKEFLGWYSTVDGAEKKITAWPGERNGTGNDAWEADWTSVYAKWGETSSPCEAFTDIDAKAWYYTAVDYALTNGLMAGMPNNLFAPNGKMTRAQFVQILYNLEGKPAIAYKPSFTDVKSGKWYTSAVLWAAENGVVSGVGGGRFNPDGSVTRAQMATILFRYFGTFKGADVSARADLSKFPDAKKIPGWANEPLQWANAVGLINGTSSNGVVMLAPDKTATRAQVAQVFYNYFTK